jgi:hypothetical protein
MKTNVMRMFLAIAAVATCGGSVYAQSYDLNVRVPFAFQVADNTFEAGKYVVRSENAGIPSVSNQAKGGKVFIAGTYPSLSGYSAPKLVFHCYSGNRCFLAQIWRGVGYGIEVPKSKAEKALANGESPAKMATIAVDMQRAD